MNIYDYIDKYGMYSFSEKEINEVDFVIFSFLSYANFSEVFLEKDCLTIQEAGRVHLGLYPSKDKNVIAVKEGNRLLRYIKDTNRYKNCLLYHQVYVGNDEVQFGAISIEYLKNKVYVSFEGTDQLISGWKENFMLSFEFPTKSHKLAIQYLNKYYTFSNKQLIVGGHSKGGNLALVGAMMANFLVKSKIKKVINADGPGLLDKEFRSDRYRKLLNKYIHIIPNYSIVGLFLNHSNDVVVESSVKGVLAHDIVYWQVEDEHFKRSELSYFTKELDREIANWYQSFSDTDKEVFIENLMDIFEKSDIHSIDEVKKNQKKILDFIYESKDMNATTKKVLSDFIFMVIKCIANTKKEEWKISLSNMFKVNYGVKS